MLVAVSTVLAGPDLHASVSGERRWVKAATLIWITPIAVTAAGFIGIRNAVPEATTRALRALDSAVATVPTVPIGYSAVAAS